MKKFSTLFLLICAFGIFQSCYVRKHPYDIVTLTAYEELMEKGRYARFIIIEDSFSPELQKGLRNTYRFGADALSDEAEKHFFEAILYFKAKQFEKAQKSFSLAAEKGNIFQASLLAVDCRRELDQEAQEDFYYAYQQLYDKAPNPLMREIVRARFKYYKYGY